ncbi:hypothetical protein B0H63DRAFT_467801 [Podospora didyma]|uniref:Uncharacterized protein n=1 Tax=Podospora didyma TaxID=330526 RepID=A0AAE0NS05_9PEZI|nr:hypothetical protein B0H63DRAFT_467801 [Podospora didyma]
MTDRIFCQLLAGGGGGAGARRLLHYLCHGKRAVQFQDLHFQRSIGRERIAGWGPCGPWKGCRCPPARAQSESACRTVRDGCGEMESSHLALFLARTNSQGGPRLAMRGKTGGGDPSILTNGILLLKVSVYRLMEGGERTNHRTINASGAPSASAPALKREAWLQISKLSGTQTTTASRLKQKLCLSEARRGKAQGVSHRFNVVYSPTHDQQSPKATARTIQSSMTRRNLVPAFLCGGECLWWRDAIQSCVEGRHKSHLN